MTRKMTWALVGALGVVVLGLVVVSIVTIFRWWATPAPIADQVLPAALPAAATTATLTPPPAAAPPTTTPAPLPSATAGPLTANQIAERAAERMSSIQTFHFSLLSDGAPYYVDSYMDSPVPVAMQAITGDVARPEKVQAQIQVTSFGLKMSVGLIKVGTITYVNNPLMGEWEQLPAEDSQALDLSAMFDPQVGLLALLSRYESTLIDTQAINGQPAYHLAVANTAEVLIPGTQGATAVEMWVDESSFVTHRVVLTGVDPGTGQIIVWSINLSAFDQPVTIVPPM
jgi:hypothetical protein